MGLLTFKGGIHPYDGKELSKDKPIKAVFPKGDVIYPLSQHIGAPAKSIVTVGDKVLVGQKIAEANGDVSAPIYASVSGVVKAIEKRRVAIGNLVDSIIIESDGMNKEVEFKAKKLEELSKQEILERIREAGIVGMGGAGFPTHVKLSPKEPEKIQYVIANCAECEPYLTSDYRRMLEEPEKLIAGLNVILKLFDNAKGYLAIEDNKPECIEKLKSLTQNESKIEVIVLQTKYPQGAERQLIYAVSGKKIDSFTLPAEVGCIVNNVDTIVAVYKGVIQGRPLMHRIVTVTGEAIQDPRNFIVPVGTNYNELIEEAGGFKQEPVKIISGGPMMGFALFDTNIPVTKTSSALLCLTKDEVAELEPTACINCGRCVEVCPSRIIPSRLADHAENQNEEAFDMMYGIECIECGSCSFICPAKRRLAQSIKAMRRISLANRKSRKRGVSE